MSALASSGSEFGELLYRLRISRALSQADVAKKAGITTCYYANLENSRQRPPPLRTLRRIILALELEEFDAECLAQLARMERFKLDGICADLPAMAKELIARVAMAGNRIPSEKLAELNATIKEYI
jgi:transcriptional regulator with XRE-family HTH domain